MEDLSVSFEASTVLQPALNHVNIQVNKGEIVAILGESGSGKSITALSISGLLASPLAQYISGSINFSINGTNLDL